MLPPHTADNMDNDHILLNMLGGVEYENSDQDEETGELAEDSLVNGTNGHNGGETDGDGTMDGAAEEMKDDIQEEHAVDTATPPKSNKPPQKLGKSTSKGMKKSKPDLPDIFQVIFLDLSMLWYMYNSMYCA